MPSKLKRLLIFIFIFGAIFLTIPHSYAAGAVDVGTSTVDSALTLGNTSPLKTATNIINILLGFLSLIAVCLILYGGFIWMTSNGSEEKIESASKILRNAAIGLVIILSAWGITYFVLNKLLDATGGVSQGYDNCTNGANLSCGCGGAQTCNAGTWGPCLGSTCDPIVDEKVSCDGKPAVAECQADNNLCGNDFNCDSTDCTCKPKAALGDSCNSTPSGNKCTADSNLCGPYLKCDSKDCVCVGPPVITGVSPSGGFCVNDSNRGCNLDTDCLGGAKCNTATPNGAGNNFVTIYGYNFGTTSKLFENILTNINFEQGAVGSVPNDWTPASQQHSSVGIVTNEFKSGKQSVRLHQDPNLPYPGTCIKAVCQDMSNCTWNSIDKTCHFSSTDQTHQSGPAVYAEGESLVWGNSYNVMWGKLTYNLAPLEFKPGETYSIQFYYKGKTSSDVSILTSANLGWSSMCAGYDYYAALKSGYSWDGSKVTPTPPAGEDPCAFGKSCADQPNTCCVNAPYQKKCYGSLNMTSIPAGTTDDWTLYSYTFQYTPEMDTWLDSTGKKAIEIGLSIGYNPTGSGTDFYVDDFTVTKILNTGQVTFLGANAGQSQLANFPRLLNPNCISSWTDREITIAVPSGAATGPIQVKREGNAGDNVDVTNNEVGPQIPDFVKNNIYRPGICMISPTQGALGSKVAYQGMNLKNGTAYFGAYSSAFKGINSNFLVDNLSGQTLAPSILAGQTTTFVERSFNGINQQSNALSFVKERDPEAGPYISSFFPVTGSVGQYITIRGSGFGNMRGSRKVLFGNKEASYAFPEVCANSVWSDSQVIVKVPEGITAGNYGINIDLGNNDIINADLLSPNNTFEVDPTVTLKTSLCKIDPIRGQIGDKVSLWGEYFGDAGTDASVVFSHNISTSSKISTDASANKITTFVPLDTTKTPATPAITGPVHVLKNGAFGNELNFTVGKCTSNSECGASSPVCCTGNTYKTGSCAASLLSCYFDVPNSVYESKFDTSLPKGGDNKFDSCIGMAGFFGTCQTGQFCPNSPGKCSPFTPSKSVVAGNCGGGTSQCGAIAYCKDNASECTYNSGNDTCQTKTCQLENEIAYSFSDDRSIPRIMFWSGKINQHWDLQTGTWKSDSDGVSGANVDQLTYCNKFYPDTVSVVEFKNEFTDTWSGKGNVGSFSANKLSYRCVQKNESTDLTATYKGSLSCREYNNKVTNTKTFVTELKVNTSCPTGWISVGGGYCVGNPPVSCNPCPTDFSCVDNGSQNNLGICQTNKICALGASCGVNPDDASKFACLVAGQAKCDCCCEIGQDTRDCCAGLKCGGTCGSDTTDDNKGFGSCTGCAIAGATVDQQDAACNCSTASGKYCDTSKPGGTCVDCAALDATGCSLHTEQCCFDSVRNACQGGDGTLLPGGKCAYYDCDATNKSQCNNTATTTGQFLATSTCATKCATNPQTACDIAGSDSAKCATLGACCFDFKFNKCTDGTEKVAGTNFCSYFNCKADKSACDLTIASTTGEYLGSLDCTTKCLPGGPNKPGASCASDVATTCDTSFCGDPYKCLAPDGSGPSTSSCGTCCCTPGATNGTLTCLANKGACSGGSRGLFCGCKSDSQCDDVANQGCGSDTCCQARPSISSTVPANDQDKVCRNSQVVINFDTLMNVETLAANMLLVEEKEYDKGTCPNGTTLSFNNLPPRATNIFARLFGKITHSIKTIFAGSDRNAIAAGPLPDKLYCVVPNIIQTETVKGLKATSTTAYIRPQKILDAKSHYFVVVKGDTNLDSNSGVTSAEKIGLNASAVSPVVNAEFNGVSFNHSYAFGFTTMDDKSGKNGLCTVNSVSVNPNSFLIKNSDNDPVDDDPARSTFDTISDNDRALTAYAYSVDKQLLQPMTGYFWNWNFSIEDSSVAKKVDVTGLSSNKIVVASQPGVTDKSTKVTASINMNNFSSASNCLSGSACSCSGDNCSNKCCNASFDGDGIGGISNLYVLLCSNPWPTEKGGIWQPWSDKCTDATGAQIPKCTDYNYKFYYCRDSGAAGVPDLPAVMDPALILGSSDLICSVGGAPCTIQNSACGTGGTCIWNVLKESYFFRESIPLSGEITEIKSTGVGGQVAISWYAPQSTASPLTSFKVYYGLTTSGASSFIKPLSLAEANCNEATPKDGKIYCSYKVSSLTDGKAYYFKISALSDKKTESPLSGTKNATPTDTTAPAKPAGLVVKQAAPFLNISWDANTDDTLYYQISHGLFAGKVADKFDSPNNAKSMELSLDNYRPGDHYFSISAIDKSGNISLRSDEVKITIAAPVK